MLIDHDGPLWYFFLFLSSNEHATRVFLYVQSLILGSQNKQDEEDISSTKPYSPEAYRTLWEPKLKWRKEEGVKMNGGVSWEQTSVPGPESQSSRKDLQEQAESPSSPLWLQAWNPPPRQNLIIKRKWGEHFPNLPVSSLGSVWIHGGSHHCRVYLAGCQPLGLEGGIMSIQCQSVWNKERRLVGWGVCFKAINYNIPRPPNTLPILRSL